MISTLFQQDAAAHSRVAAGRLQLETVLAFEDTGCWTASVASLAAGCRSLGIDDMQRSRLAVRFTNCHLRKSGLRTYACTPAMSVLNCTRPMVDSPSGLAYSTYTSFYTHAESMCFYLQSEMFQDLPCPIYFVLSYRL